MSLALTPCPDCGRQVAYVQAEGRRVALDPAVSVFVAERDGGDLHTGRSGLVWSRWADKTVMAAHRCARGNP